MDEDTGEQASTAFKIRHFVLSSPVSGEETGETRKNLN